LCNTQKHTATHTATKLKHNATQCHRYIRSSHGRVDELLHLTLQQTETLCSTLQHILQHILQRIRSVFTLTCRCNSCTLHFNTLRHTAAHCNTLQHIYGETSNGLVDELLHLTLQQTAAHCSTLQHTATHTYLTL